MNDPDYWLRYRKADLVAQIAAEEALGRNTGLLHAAKRMVAHLEGREAEMNPEKDYATPEPITIKSYDSRPVGEPLVADPISIIMCDDCPTPHPKAFCPQRITADKENTLGKKKDDLRDLRSDHDLMRDFVHRQNITVSKRLDTLENTVADLTGRMGSREDAAHSLVEALDDVNKSLDTTDECVAVLKDTVAKLADCVENLNRAQEHTTSSLKTQHHLVQRLKKRLDQQHDEMVMIDRVNKNHVELIGRLLGRVSALEDRLAPPSPDESLEYRIVQQDDEPHGIGLDGRCGDCDGPEADTVLSAQERLDLIGRWMHPGLWSAMDGRREAILKILGGQHVEPPLAGGGSR